SAAGGIAFESNQAGWLLNTKGLRRVADKFYKQIGCSIFITDYHYGNYCTRSWFWSGSDRLAGWLSRRRTPETGASGSAAAKLSGEDLRLWQRKEHDQQFARYFAETG